MPSYQQGWETVWVG
jgi:hypothetical protein